MSRKSLTQMRKDMEKMAKKIHEKEKEVQEKIGKKITNDFDLWTMKDFNKWYDEMKTIKEKYDKGLLVDKPKVERVEKITPQPKQAKPEPPKERPATTGTPKKAGEFENELLQGTRQRTQAKN